MSWHPWLLALALVPGSIALAPAAGGNREAGVNFLHMPRKLASSDELLFRFDDGSGWRPARIRNQWHEKRPYDYRIRPFGKLRVEVTVSRRGKIVARVQTKIPVSPDRYYNVRADISPDDPTRYCMGCSKAVSAPIVGENGPAAHRLWLHYGFNRISRPVIF